MSSEKSPKFLTRGGGFTLVELLIVIVVIGILSAMMMLSSTEAVTTAKANNIVVAMRQWKTATLAWYADNIDKVNVSNGCVMGNDGTWRNDKAIQYRFGDVIKAEDIAHYLNGIFTPIKKGFAYKYTGSDVVKDKSGLMFWTQHSGDDRNGFTWYIGCQFANDNKNVRLQQKLEARAATAGLYYMGKGQYTAQGNGGGADAHFVWIEVMKFGK